MYVQTNKKHSDCFHKGFIAINGGKLDMYEAEEVIVLVMWSRVRHDYDEL